MSIDNDYARSHADNLDAKAEYYRHRAIQAERALGPGHYADLLGRWPGPGRNGAADTDPERSDVMSTPKPP